MHKLQDMVGRKSNTPGLGGGQSQIKVPKPVQSCNAAGQAPRHFLWRAGASTQYLKKNPPPADSMTALSQPGGPHCLPFPAGHDIVPPHWLPGGFGEDVGTHEPRLGHIQILHFALDLSLFDFSNAGTPRHRKHRAAPKLIPGVLVGLGAAQNHVAAAARAFWPRRGGGRWRWLTRRGHRGGRRSQSLPHGCLKLAQHPPTRTGLTTSWKEAKLETGLQIMVPLFIANGDIIRVDTAGKKYLGKE